MRRLFWGLALLLALLLPSQPALAHPLDQLIHDLRVQLHPTTLALEVQLIAGPLITPRLWAAADADGSQTLDAAEIQSWIARYMGQTTLLLDGSPLTLSPGEVLGFPTAKVEFIGEGATILHWTATAPLPPLSAGPHELRMRGHAYAEISVYDWSKTRGFQGIVVREGAQGATGEMIFPVKWPAAFSAPVSAMSAPAQAPAGQSQSAPPALLARLKAGPGSPLVLLATLLAALAFGALHALQPGHGKTLVAAYLVGSRGTLRHAALLGGIVTLTHTLSVIILGVLLLIFSVWVRLEQIIPTLTLASGLLVAGVGGRMLWERWRLARQNAAAPMPAGLHDHGSGPHAHLSDGRIVSLGVSGGLVPCPEALVILIVAASQGRLGLGLAMIVAFSLGLALVLIAIGVALVISGQRLRRHSSRLGRLPQWLPVVSAVIVVALGAGLVWQGLGLLLRARTLAG